MGYIRLTRPRLLRRLRQAVSAGHAMLSAPPGYGKSTLLHTLAADHPNTHYLLLAAEDADLGYLQARLQPLITAGATLLLDDLHHLHEATEALAWLAGHLRLVKSHFVLSGRQIPPPLQTLLLRQGALHLTIADLTFTRVESQALLGKQAPTVQDWYAHTQGWPLALALLAQQAPLDPHTFVQMGSTLFDYLAETLLAALPAPLLNFMQVTAVPLRINDTLAAHLLAVTVEEAASWRHAVQQRNLFLEPTDQAGWYRYHELIRTFLHQHWRQPQERIAYFQQIIRWLLAHDDLPMAIEHAQVAGLYEQSADLLLTLPRAFVLHHGRYHTYHRWITSLPGTVQSRYPLLLSRLGRELLYVGWRTEAWHFLQQGQALAATHPEPAVQAQAQLAVAAGHYHDGQPLVTVTICEVLLGSPTAPAELRRWAFNLLAGALAQLSRFREARRAHEAALALPEDRFTRPDPVIRKNLVAIVLTPLGDFAAAADMLTTDAPYFADKPIERISYLLAWSGLYEGMGDWAGLATTLDAITAAEAAAEVMDQDDMWRMWHQALLQIGRGDFAAATTALERTSTMIGDDAERAICVAWARVWQARRQAQFATAVDLARSALAEPWAIPYYRGLLALEAAIAHVEAQLAAQEQVQGASPTVLPIIAPDLGQELHHLITLRARAHLVRLRALLAVVSYWRGDQRWHRHRRALRRRDQPAGYASLLIQRDPQLGVHWWTICVVEGIEPVAATAALRAIGVIEPLTRLLLAAPTALPPPLAADPTGPWVGRLCQALAALGQEAAIPHLAARLEQTTEAPLRATLAAALTQLEGAPPPPLAITLLGDFRLVRGGNVVPDSAWQRPAAKRLFQFFVLHRGRPLTRDQLLDALWPESDPQQARTSFRTLYSWVRKALEPYLRPKSPSRYFTVEGELYTFDAQRNPALVSLDSEQFEGLIRPFLLESEREALPQPTPTLLAALNAWQPLLPEVAYESWVLAPRERLQDLYVQGALAVAQAFLALDQASEAALWAAKAIQLAPWLEEGYQALMRAQARMGQRSLALKTYSACVTALSRELDVAPSARTEWLAKRLRADEAI